MAEGGPLVNIDLKGLSKPATTLIEKVADAVGGIARPGQIVRVANAEAKAEIVRAEARIKISEIEERALQRMVREEGLRQENIESITAQALPHIKDDAKPEEVEKDWITNFFEKSRLTSDREMQSLWANILAGQANAPGSFSKKTIETVATLDKSDAELFTNLCTFVWVAPSISALIYDEKHAIYNSHGINFSSIIHLSELGLLTFSNLSSYVLQGLPKYQTFFYYGRPVTVEFPEIKDNTLDVGKVFLSRTGIELAGVCGSKPSKEYFEYIVDALINKGLALSCPVGGKAVHASL